MQLFSERYSKLIDNSDFGTSPPILDFQKIKWLELLLDFDESSVITPNRFDTTYEVDTYIRFEIFETYFSNRNIKKSHEKQITIDGNYTIWELFDITELWHLALSDFFKPDFRKDYNQLFSSFKLPWRLLDNGRIIKIDTSQFSEDLKNRALEQLQSMQANEPLFQSAFEEFCKANEKRTNKDYLGSILDACKSYESLLKIITGQKNGTADQLLKTLIGKRLLNIPDSINSNGFNSNVLNALPYLRNQLPTAHGAGEASTIEITDAFCNLALNLASSLNIYLMEDYKERITIDTKNQSIVPRDDIPF